MLDVIAAEFLRKANRLVVISFVAIDGVVAGKLAGFGFGCVIVKQGVVFEHDIHFVVFPFIGIGGIIENPQGEFGVLVSLTVNQGGYTPAIKLMLLLELDMVSRYTGSSFVVCADSVMVVIRQKNTAKIVVVFFII